MQGSNQLTHTIEEVQFEPINSKILKTSSLPISKEILEYLTKLVESDPYNKFCIDCFINKSTHAIITYGIFICKNCAAIHHSHFSQSEHYIKNI